MTASREAWRSQITCVDLSQSVCRLSTCRGPLPAGRTAYCSDDHARQFELQHFWRAARRAARRRAKYACQRCHFKPSEIRKDPALRSRYARHELSLQVNHIQPLVGRYRTLSCLNHAQNLEVLCHRCHLDVTTAQRRELAATRS